jgi:hypothetical protein
VAPDRILHRFIRKAFTALKPFERGSRLLTVRRRHSRRSLKSTLDGAGSMVDDVLDLCTMRNVYL